MTYLTILAEKNNKSLIQDSFMPYCFKESSLHYAIRQELDCVVVIVEHILDVNILNLDKQTVLDYAICKSSTPPRIIEALKKLGTKTT